MPDFPKFSVAPHHSPEAWNCPFRATSRLRAASWELPVSLYQAGHLRCGHPGPDHQSLPADGPEDPPGQRRRLETVLRAVCVFFKFCLLIYKNHEYYWIFFFSCKYHFLAYFSESISYKRTNWTRARTGAQGPCGTWWFLGFGWWNGQKFPKTIDDLIGF